MYHFDGKAIICAYNGEIFDNGVHAGCHGGDADTSLTICVYGFQLPQCLLCSCAKFTI
jgi:hypothetical protein